ncbi:MAG TPA: hypothetical protein VJ438_06020 [Candidatus Nanoarchaeia archaeon]|nr:hypothetical protein [Candidatus Nanoarchaeia archaeon]
MEIDYRFLGSIILICGGYISGATIIFQDFRIWALVSALTIIPAMVLGLLCMDKYYKRKYGK